MIRLCVLQTSSVQITERGFWSVARFCYVFPGSCDGLPWQYQPISQGNFPKHYLLNLATDQTPRSVELIRTAEYVRFTKTTFGLNIGLRFGLSLPIPEYVSPKMGSLHMHMSRLEIGQVKVRESAEFYSVQPPRPGRVEQEITQFSRTFTLHMSIFKCAHVIESKLIFKPFFKPKFYLVNRNPQKSSLL